MKVFVEAAAELAKNGHQELARDLLKQTAQSVETASTKLTPAERRKLKSAIWKGWSKSDKDGKLHERELGLHSHERARLVGKSKDERVKLSELTDDQLLRVARHVTRTFANDPRLEKIFCKHGFAGCY